MDPGATANHAAPAEETKSNETNGVGFTNGNHRATADVKPTKPKQRSRRKKGAEEDEEEDSSKRRCVSTACIACRKRKSKCDGNQPACAACEKVYNTDCIYDPNSDHRRKGVYKNAEQDGLDKTRNSTLHTLIQALLNYPEEDVPGLVREIRTCESLDAIAEKITARENGEEVDDDEDTYPNMPSNTPSQPPTFETKLYGKMGELRLDDGTVRYIGGTSNLIHLNNDDAQTPNPDEYNQQEDPITSWTAVTSDPELVVHLLNMYFTWHYTYFTTLSKTLFYRDFMLGRPPNPPRRKTQYCTPLLVNAILAIGCHFTSHPGGREDAADSATAGDHFFREAKRLIMEHDEHEKPRLTTVQALALMSVREAGCGREAKGWVYSGMSFRMACDMGLNLNSGQLSSNKHANPDEAEEDARRITFWGCFLFDKCWSNYLGRLPQLPRSITTALKAEVFPDEESVSWAPYSDSGFTQSLSQPARTRAVALQITRLCEISNDLMVFFYNPSDMEERKGRQAELKRLGDIHTRLEGWRRELPRELEPREGGLSSVLVMHMFFQLLFIHLFRPFLRYTSSTSPLPPSVSPRKLCTQAAAMISKLLRLYKRSHGLRQICNIAVYIAHSACTIHLLNLPDKHARRDLIHGVKHLEEIAEGWLCARRTLGILSVLARKWQVQLPEEAAVVLARTDAKFGPYNGDVPSPIVERRPSQPAMQPSQFSANNTNYDGWPSANPATVPPDPASRAGYFPPAAMPSAPAATTANNMASGSRKPNAASTSASGASQSARPSTSNSNYQLPPTNASGLRAPTLPSATPTPRSHTLQRQHTGSTAAEGPKSHASPSDMFGGIEQLLRDSQDWAYKDQAAYATGFGNWGAHGSSSQGYGHGGGNGHSNSLEAELGPGVGLDPGIWAGDSSSVGGVEGGLATAGAGVHRAGTSMLGAQAVGGPAGGFALQSRSTAVPGGFQGGNAGAVLNAGTGMGGGGGAGFGDLDLDVDVGVGWGNGMSTYNEDEWYQ